MRQALDRLLSAYRSRRIASGQRSAHPELAAGQVSIRDVYDDAFDALSIGGAPDVDRLIFEWSEAQCHPELAPLVSARFEVAVELLRRRRESR